MKENEKKVTNGDCNMLARAIGDLIQSVPKMKIGTLTYFKKIQKKLDVINSKAFKAQQEILKRPDFSIAKRFKTNSIQNSFSNSMRCLPRIKREYQVTEENL